MKLYEISETYRDIIQQIESGEIPDDQAVDLIDQMDGEWQTKAEGNDMKILKCGKCKKTKPTSEFNKATTRESGFQYWCKLCARSHYAIYIAKKRKPKRRKTLLERMLEKIQPITESGCWIWTAGADEHGYGRIGIRGKHFLAHRAFFETQNPPLKPNENLCHKCDVPSCVRPDHMFIGTQADNMEDMMKKGRFKKKGENHWNSKLKESDVINIRMLIANGNTQESIAAQYGVNRKAISNIATMRNWGWL